MDEPRVARRGGCAAGVAFLCFAVSAATIGPSSLAEESGWVRQQVFERLGTGVRHLRSGNARAAAESLCWAAERALNSHEAAWLCGRALLRAREPGRAIQFLELATNLQPRHLESWVTLGDAFLSDGQVDRARAAYFEALEIREDHSPAFDGLARLAWQTGDEKRALALYADALKANPADARARLNRGHLHLEAGRISQALEDIREAARLRPDDGEVQLGLARVLLRSGIGNDALAAARRAAEILPADPRPLALQSRVLLDAGDLGTAERAARSALELDAAEVEARLVLGELLGRTDRIDEGISVLEQTDTSRLSEKEIASINTARESWERRREDLAELAVRADSDDAPASLLLTLARARLEVGDAERAVELARRAAGLPGLSPLELRHAAYVLGSAGELLESEKIVDGIVASGAVLPEDLVNLAVAREMSGDPEGAETAYRRSLTLPLPPAVAHLGLARLALAAGDRPAAIAHLLEFLTADPDSDAALRVTEALKLLGPKPGRGAAAGGSP